MESGNLFPVYNNTDFPQHACASARFTCCHTLRSEHGKNNERPADMKNIASAGMRSSGREDTGNRPGDDPQTRRVTLNLFIFRTPAGKLLKRMTWSGQQAFFARSRNIGRYDFCAIRTIKKCPKASERKVICRRNGGLGGLEPRPRLIRGRSR